ncbi:hypothetical protein A4X13_0g5538 [Tilletia indica]|uniref:Peptidase S8/S53 domain-containing protein n=1 Tax=Tilletia indica TaxID=43049 RepID=A0A8T8SUU1_9BASI|nr:hypothetical protein A4X13_0g5538 [Tilletia indica]
MTGIDKVHADGNLGQGIVIGLLDDGVDYTHHALNGGLKDGVPCLGPSCPISGGEGDWGHGTHTAGTIIADDKIRGFTGGSPRAQLKAYRVLDCEGNAPDDIVAAAMQRASFDGVDLISMSLGRSSGWRESFLDIVSKRITDAGMPIVTSSGNDGGAGAFCTYAPAGGEGVHTVGSVGNLHIPGFTATVKTKSSSFTFVYAAVNPVSLNGSQSLPVFLNSLTGVDDTCAPLKKGISLEHSIPVIAIRDDCYTKDQANNVIAANANIALWYIDSSSPLLTVYVDIGIPGFQPLITDERSGKRIVEAVKAEGDVTIDFSNPEASYIEDNVEGGFTASYSSYGPDWEVNSYVGSTGVGSNILSTFPLSKGGYAIISGTSMSTPLTASAYALYMSAKGKKETPAQLRSVFATTATPLYYSPAVKVLDTVAQQGGGLWNVARAIASTSRVWPDRLNLNDTEFFNGTQKLTVTNVGPSPQTIHVGHMPAGTVYTRGAGEWNDGGQSKTVTVTFKAPKSNQETMPLFSGYITFKYNEDSGNLNVPYLGVAAKMSELPVISKNAEDSLPAIVDPTSQGPVKGSATYNLRTEDQQPIFQYALKAGSALATVDLVYAHSTTATSFRRDSAQSSHLNNSAVDVPAGAIVGNLDTEAWIPRSYDQPMTVTITEKIYDDRGGSKTIQDGEYRVLLRVLKLRGNPNDPKDFESFLSNKFVVKRK